MKIGDKIYDSEMKRYGIVTGLVLPQELMRTMTPEQVFDQMTPQELDKAVKEVKYQPYQNGKPVGTPTIAQVAQVVIIAMQIWDLLHPFFQQVLDLFTPDPARVAARQEARRIRREAKKHLPK